MGFRTWGNIPLFSTTAATVNNPSTATLCAELIIPVTGSTTTPSKYDVRFSVGASTGALWRLECAQSSGLGSSALRVTENDSSNAFEQVVVFTGSNQTSEFVYTMKAFPGDRFRIVPLSSFTGTAACAIQAEDLA